MTLRVIGFPRHTARRRGSVLMDVMVGTLLLSIVALTLLPVYHSSLQAGHRSQSRELATQIARGELDKWRRQGFDALPTVPEGSSSVAETFTPPNTLPNPTGAVVVTQVDPDLVATTSETDRRGVAVTVSWNDSRLNHGSVTLTTLLTN